MCLEFHGSGRVTACPAQYLKWQVSLTYKCVSILSLTACRQHSVTCTVSVMWLLLMRATCPEEHGSCCAAFWEPHCDAVCHDGCGQSQMPRSHQWHKYSWSETDWCIVRFCHQTAWWEILRKHARWFLWILNGRPHHSAHSLLSFISYSFIKTSNKDLESGCFNV